LLSFIYFILHLYLLIIILIKFILSKWYRLCLSLQILWMKQFFCVYLFWTLEKILLNRTYPFLTKLLILEALNKLSRILLNYRNLIVICTLFKMDFFIFFYNFLFILLIGFRMVQRRRFVRQFRPNPILTDKLRRELLLCHFRCFHLSSEILSVIKE
jgi:hypothetical protein